MKILHCLAAIAMTACATLPTDDGPRSLAQAETEFAAHSLREDMRMAFLAHFAPGGVFVRDGWVVARDALANQPRPPFVLAWAPRYVEAAASADLGLSTGPWKLTSRDKPDQPASHGQYVSVWTRSADGPWQVLVDLGISHPQPRFWDSKIEARRSPGVAHEESLAHAEERFAALSISSGVQEAYRRRGASDLRLYREGEVPRSRLGDSLASGWLQGLSKVRWTIEAQAPAASGELGYARGTAVDATTGRALGAWLRVWRREDSGWRIVMDAVQPPRS